MDFSRLVDLLDRHKVTFVSVTQSFNTTTSMGRLTLNILLSFAQLERELVGERVRDKVLASRRKGMWMGGLVPFGYRLENKKLVIDDAEGPAVRDIFERFAETGSATAMAKAIGAEGTTTRSGKPIEKGFVYKLLYNRVYIGQAVHKGIAYPGEHAAIIPQPLWDKVHAIMEAAPRTRAGNTRSQTPALLKGILFAPSGCAMSPTHTRKRGKLYRYYVSQDVLKHGPEACPVRRLPAAELEGAVIDQLRAILRTPEIIVGTWRAARAQDAAVSEADVRTALEQLDPLWDELFPAEQARIVQLLVERVDVTLDGIDIRLRVNGLRSIVGELGAAANQKEAA